MKFEPFIARRYLFSGSHRALVSVITFISVAGVAVGVFALIVVLAVMEGFDANLTEKIMGAYAHMEIVPATANAPQINAEDMLKKLRAMPEVKAAGPVIMRQGLVEYREGGPSSDGARRQTGMFVLGVDYNVEPQITSMMRKVKGEAKPTSESIVIGKNALQKTLYAPLGATVTVWSPERREGPNGPVIAVRQMQLAGAFETGFPETDSMMAYMSLEDARDLFLLPDDYVDGIHLVVHDVNKVGQVRDKIQKALGNEVSVMTWKERNPVLFDALQLEKWAMFIILLLIVLVAAFNIIGTLIMTVMEKTREIGILKSMGATQGTIMRIFIYQGVWIGAIGTATGGALGLFVCYLLKYHIKISILSEAYLTDRIPLLMNPWMEALIIVSAMLICLLASVYPARQAARLDPVEALRYE